MAKIYKITNVINGKMYIGKTEGDIQERFKQHQQDKNKRRNEKRPLYNAMNKYGIENFTIELLEITNNPKEKEQYYIKKYNTYGNTGYNATIGGDGRAWLDHNAIIKCYEKEQNSIKVAKIMDCCSESVRNILHNNNIEIKSCYDIGKETLGIKVFQYDNNGEYIQSFNSYTDAGRWLIENNYSKAKKPKVAGNHVSRYIRKERDYAYGFDWKLNKENAVKATNKA